jgi:hypothetical protein
MLRSRVILGVLFNENACYVAANMAYTFGLISAMEAPWYQHYFPSLPLSDWDFSYPQLEN